jgi:CheY-like chemotaxis protein
VKSLSYCREYDSAGRHAVLGARVSEALGPVVLYVEDEEMVREVGLAALEEAGFTVEAVKSGAAAVKAIDARDEAYRGIVTDIDLGGRLNGWEVARHAREKFPDIPVVYVSGASAHEWTSMGVPGSLMVAKPYAPAQLVVAVSTAMLPAEGRSHS